MATGINYDDPEVQKGMELFETLFADRRDPSHVPEKPPALSPERERILREEERQKGFALFEELFYDRLHPPERTPEGSSPEWATSSEEKSYESDETSPEVSYHSPILSLLEEPVESYEEAVQQTPSPEKPKRARIPEPKRTIIFGKLQPVNYFDEAMYQMQDEFEKYAQDKKHIVKFVELAPSVRDYEKLTKELIYLVNLYVPGGEQFGDPYLNMFTLHDYIKETERKLEERYEDLTWHEISFPGISEGVKKAMCRLHKNNALEAIDTYKRNYFVLQKEIDKLEEETNVLRRQRTIEDLEINELLREMRRLEKEEAEALKEYEANLRFRHYEDCPYRKDYEEARNRFREVKKLVPLYEQERNRARAAYEKDVEHLQLWVAMFPPSLIDDIRELLSERLKRGSYEPASIERYMILAKDLSSSLQRMKDDRVKGLNSCKSRCNNTRKVLSKTLKELEGGRRIINEQLEVSNRLKSELGTIRREDKTIADLWNKLKLEKFHYQTFNETLLGRVIALDITMSFENEPGTSILESISPSLGGSLIQEPGSASPRSVGSGTFNLTQQETSPDFNESFGLLEDERPPSEMLNVSDFTQSRGSSASAGSPNEEREQSPATEPTPQSPWGSDNFLGDEEPPSAMLNISGLSGSGSPIDSLEDSRSPIDSLEASGSSLKKTFIIPSPSKQEQLRMEIEVIPQEIRRSPSGQRVVCDLAVEMQEAARRPPRPIERRNIVVRGTPLISQTVGRRFDRRYGMFTPQSSFRRRHVGVRRPLFEGDFESPDSPYGTGRRTHPEFMDLTPRVSTPRSPHATTIEWET